MPKLFQRYFTDDWVSLYLTINAFKISRKVRLNYIHCKRSSVSIFHHNCQKNQIKGYLVILQFSKFQFDKNICFSLNRVQHEDTINEEIHSNMHTYIFICQLMGQIPPLQMACNLKCFCLTPTAIMCSSCICSILVLESL